MSKQRQHKPISHTGTGVKLSERSKLPPFLALDVLQQAQALGQAGRDIIHLEIGQPSTAAPEPVNQALKQHLDDRSAHGYTVAFGETALRAAIAGHYDSWYGTRPPVDNIAVTVGSSTAFAVAFMAAFDAGDVIAIPRPGYPAYRNLMMGMGLTPRHISAGPEQGWKPMLEEMESWDRLPEGLMIASPSNPTGTVLDSTELQTICTWCDRNGVRLISDEIYHGLAFSKTCDTALNYNKDAIIINSFSKYFSMTGWRIGWMILPDQLIEASQKLIQNLFISAPTAIQRACVSAFECYDEFEAHKIRYQQNRDLLLSGLPRQMTDSAAPSDGAFYLYADISSLTDDSISFAKALLQDESVATTPGVDFDPIDGHKYLRLSFAGSPDHIEEAVRRINRFIGQQKSAVA